MTSDKYIKLNNVRLVFPHLFEPNCWTGDDGVESAPKFSARFIIDKNKNSNEINEINKKVDLLITPLKMTRDRLNAKGAKHVVLKDPYSVKTYLEAYDNSFLINSSSLPTSPPVLLEKDGKTHVKDTSRFYSGCYVNAYISIRVTTKYDIYVGANLHAVQFMSDGDRIGGEVFDPEGMFTSVEDSSDLLDDQIPF